MITRITIIVSLILLCFRFGMGQVEHFAILPSVSSILEYKDGNYLLGGRTPHTNQGELDIQLFILDSLNGQILNQFAIGIQGRKENLKAMTYSNDGDLLISGSIVNQSNSDPFVVKLDSNFNMSWEMILPNFGSSQSAYSITELSNNNIALLSSEDLYLEEKSFLYILNPYGIVESIDSFDYRINQVIESADSSLVFIGYQILDNSTAKTVVFKRSSDGDILWTHFFGDNNGWDIGKSIILTEDNGFLLAINDDGFIFDGHPTPKLIKVDSECNTQYEIDLPGGSPSYIYGNSQNGYALTSSYAYFNNYGNLIWITYAYKLSPEGFLECFESFDARVDEYATNAIISSNGFVVTVSNEYLTSNSFITKMNPNCELITEVRDLDLRHKVTVYPNPVINELTIATSLTDYKVELFDSHGVQVKAYKSNSNQTTLQVDDLGPGIYWVLISKKDNLYVQKLIKQ